MSDPLLPTSRRLFLGTAALGVAAFSVRGAFAEELVKTPRQTEGPFYPNKLPLDTDNDLLIINDFKMVKQVVPVADIGDLMPHAGYAQLH